MEDERLWPVFRYAPLTLPVTVLFAGDPREEV